MDIVYLLSGFNQLLASAITILAFSLAAYMLFNHFGNSVGRAFTMLLLCLTFTYAGDVALFRVRSVEDAIPWLNFQWIGIAFMPAAYLHFVDALLRTTNAHSPRRRFAVMIAYLFGVLLLLLALQTEHLVRDAFYSPGMTQFRAGPFFQVFSIYFYITVIWGIYKVFSARSRCLTIGARRRMTYLAFAFIAPALGVYPYMLIASNPSFEKSTTVLSVMFIGNIGIASTIMIMAYSVVFFGALPPDRVIKHSLAHFLLRGPMIAITVITIIQALPKKAEILGLPRDFILAVLIVTVIVLAQQVVHKGKGFLDRLMFHQDRQEIIWFSELDRRLLTTTDLQQVLENILITLCEQLRVQTGFIYSLNSDHIPQLEIHLGSVKQSEAALSNIDVKALIDQQNGQDRYHFTTQNGFWFVILQNKARSRSLGILGIEARSVDYDLIETEATNATMLLTYAEMALEDRLLQQEVFDVLRDIIPDMERMQQLRSAVPYTDSPNLITNSSESPVNQQDFSQLVREALKHYWGGPKLTNSPLLNLQVVQAHLPQHDHNSVRALRFVLNEAIEKQKPNSDPNLNTAEWLIYNILDLKFIQGLRVRDIAQKLAMSESDLYRKQRLAIDEVARTLREMETQGNQPINTKLS